MKLKDYFIGTQHNFISIVYLPKQRHSLHYYFPFLRNSSPKITFLFFLRILRYALYNVVFLYIVYVMCMYVYVCICVEIERHTKGYMVQIYTYVLWRKSTIFPLLPARFEGVQWSEGKERLSGIIRRCRAVYRTFALRSLIRVLYIYTVLTQQRPGRFVCSPPVRHTIPLNILPYPFSHPFSSRGVMKGTGGRVSHCAGPQLYPLRNPSHPFRSLFDCVCTRVYKEGGHVISKDPPLSLVRLWNTIDKARRRRPFIFGSVFPFSLLSFVLATTHGSRTSHTGGVQDSLVLLFGFVLDSLPPSLPLVLFLTYSSCSYIVILHNIYIYIYIALYKRASRTRRVGYKKFACRMARQ